MRLVAVAALAGAGAVSLFLQQPRGPVARPDRIRPLLARSPAKSFVAALNVLARPTTDQQSDAARFHAWGVTSFESGDDDKAARYFRMALDRESHAAWWNDVAAAELRMGDRAHDPERYIASLEAAGRALALDGECSEAHFNRAMAIERLGFERASIDPWRKFIALDPGAPWADVVRQHIAQLSARRTSREEWTDARERVDQLTTSDLERLIASYPEEARLWGETMFLTDWASTRRPIYLDRTRVIAERLKARSGEQFLTDALAAIDHPRNSRCTDTLAATYQTYITARREFKARDYASSTRDFESSRTRFATCGSPMSAVCDLYLAMTAIQTNRAAEARASLMALHDRELRLPGHHALVAQIEYHLALSSAMLGEFGDALTMAAASRDRFARLGERGNTGTSDTLMGDLLAIVGQPRLAWRHQVDAAAALSVSGLWERLQACASAMNQVELHRHRWSAARAISEVETSLGGDPVFLADAHLRNAFAAAEDGDPVAAELLLRKAKVTTASIADSETREKIFADIAGAEGRMMISSDPTAAIARLTSSIDFQRRTGRVFMLPDLLLTRGRAYLALGAHSSALADFDEGIRALESQRSRIRDYELRTGVFDDTRALFPEAVAASLAAGDIENAFQYLERGRARALLDRLSGQARLPALVSLHSVQQQLEPGDLLVAFAALSKRTAIFAITRDTSVVRFSNVTAGEMATQSSDFVRLLRKRKNIHASSAGLHDQLLRPIAAELHAARKVIIIPDASLEGLPFAALFDRNAQKFLAETHDLLVEPSAAVYIACKQSPVVNDASTIAVFANPATASMEALPAAEQEAPKVARQYAGSVVLIRGDATSSNFVRQASRHGIVQFSGHAVIDRSEPWKSALMFDVPLTAREIGTMRFPRTRFVMLAACSTGAFDSEHVEGTSAIAQSFLTAGVVTVAGTLWDISDSEAATFVVRLHQHLSHGMAPAKAIADTQRDFIRENRSPAAWSPFVVLGNGSN